MASGAPVALILGAGPGVGEHCARHFAAKGYDVAVAARSFQDRIIDKGRLELQIDLARPEMVPEVFTKVKRELSTPSVIIYNGAVRTIVSPEDPLCSLSLDEYHQSVAVNLTSAFVAAREAVAGFKELPASDAKTFIYSGNKLNVMSDPKTMPFGITKTAAARMVWDCCNVYRDQGLKFYYTVELLEDGRPAREAMDPARRAEIYLQLAEEKDQGPWHYTYVKEKGYVDFRSIDKPWEV